jgi:hypothetical protein
MVPAAGASEMYAHIFWDKVGQILRNPSIQDPEMKEMSTKNLMYDLYEGASHMASEILELSQHLAPFIVNDVSRLCEGISNAYKEIPMQLVKNLHDVEAFHGTARTFLRWKEMCLQNSCAFIGLAVNDINTRGNVLPSMLDVLNTCKSTGDLTEGFPYGGVECKLVPSCELRDVMNTDACDLIVQPFGVFEHTLRSTLEAAMVYVRVRGGLEILRTSALKGVEKTSLVRASSRHRPYNDNDDDDDDDDDDSDSDGQKDS